MLIWNWATITRRNAEQTAKLAAGDDPTAAWTDFLLLSATIASLAAVGLVILAGTINLVVGPMR